jgi:hypothetical protein
MASGKPVELGRDLRDDRRVVGGQPHPGSYTRSTLSEEPHGVVVGNALEIGAMARIGNRQGWNRELLLPRQMQRNSAGGQHLQPWCRGDKAAYRGCRFDDLLNVVWTSSNSRSRR